MEAPEKIYLFENPITEREYNRLLEWERKNFESGGRLYAERLAKALTPNPKWFR